MKLFISHVSNEGPLANVLKDWIEKAFGGQIEIFVSSNIKNLPAGSVWLRKLEKALSDAEALIVLCSRYSSTRPWVMFESGGAWVKKIPIIPICHSGQKKNKLPSPLSAFQGLEVESPDFAGDFFESLVAQLNLNAPAAIDQKLMEKKIKAALKKIKARANLKSAGRKIQKSRKQITLSKKDVDILKKIATSNNESCTCKKLAKFLKMRANDLDVHLRYLIDQKFVTKKPIKDGDPQYHTTRAGLSYLVHHKLI